jgi:hypothetical protein
VDVELSFGRPFSTKDELRRNMDGAIYGGADRRFGLPYQLEMLARHDLKGVFFVEALCADVIGFEPLAEIVTLIRSAGQEVQLHAHTEWMRRYPPNLLKWLTVDKMNNNLWGFTRDQQVRILRHATANLRQVGVIEVLAFRAGNFGANRDTLAALASVGIPFDSSYDACLADRAGVCRIDAEAPITDRHCLDGIVEIPVTCFDDRLFGTRHLQLCSVSTAEMRGILLGAHAAGRYTACIVMHSFELLNRAFTREHPIHVARFDGLCSFLGSHRELLPTVAFADLDADAISDVAVHTLLRSSALATLARVGSQLFGRIYE